MLAISSVLGQLIVNRHEYALSSDRDSRIIVPGLTPRVSGEVQDYLVSKGITAYLVIGDDLSPDKDRFWIRPVGLTSRRIGSFVAVACPGQLVHIQDSVRGSGGTIRSVAFSEEWPWIDDGNESFRFDGPVLQKLVDQWSDNEEHRQWLYEFVLTCLVPNTRSSSQRARLLLENLVGSFSPSLYSDLDDVRLKMLFHSGVPRPTGDIPSVNRLRQETSTICKRIVDKCRKEDRVRQQALDMVPKVVPSADESIVQESLNTLLDGIGQSETLDLGLLAFLSCWGGNREYWSALDQPCLERIFEIEPRERAEVTYEIRCDRSRSLISSNVNNIATFHGQNMVISGTYKLPQDELDKYEWTLQLTYRRSILHHENIDSPEGHFSLRLDTENTFSRYKSSLPLKLSLLADSDTRYDARIRLHLCGPDRPAFTVVEPGFTVIDASARNEDENPDKKFQSNESSHIYMFSHDCLEPSLLDIDENEVPIIETGSKGIWRSGSRIDPLEDASGQITRICQFGSLASVICFESVDIERGEFTIEDELRVQVAGQREANIRELINIFDGLRREPFHRLGKINDSSRRRIVLANDFTSERGWQPLLVDLLGTDYDAAGMIGDYITYRGRIDAPAFSDLSLPEQARGLLTEYASIRFSIIGEIWKNVEKTEHPIEHPDYATHPIYVDSQVSEMSNMIVRYLQAYLKIINYIEQSNTGLEWSQLFVLIYLDCIVHWDNSVLRNSFFLLGPWHPLVLAKRFMIQASLLSRAKSLDNRNGKTFRRLAVLLSEITGFRWLIGLHRNDRLLEPLYVTPTSDPGWHLAIKQDLSSIAAQSRVGSLFGILQGIKEALGLESSVVQGYTEDLASLGVNGFIRAFPSRRSIGLRVRAGYSTSDIVSSLDRLLHEDEGPTEVGSQLPGGIHLYSEESFDVPEGIKRHDPPILVYHHETDQECFLEANPDIYLLAPARAVSFRPADEKHGLPRGLGKQAAFSEPLCWLTEGQAQLPNSITLEFDEHPQDTDDLGKSFVEVTAQICQALQNRIVIVRSIDLPQRLDSPWAIVPGNGLDPAIFVKYIRDGSGRSIQERALWDYRLDITGSKSTYYILSTIPRGFNVAVNGFFGKDDISSKFIEDLGSLGIAIGGEALKSGRHGLGVVGLTGAIRLLNGIGGTGRGAFVKDKHTIGFLIPIDSFVSFFGRKFKMESASGDDLKRTDLLAIQLVLPKDGESNLQIYACGIESKFVSRTYNQARAFDALRQARASLEQFRSLVEISRENWAMPERLGLLSIIRFGLRIASPSNQENICRWIETEGIILRCILRGKYEYRNALRDAVLVSTEGQLQGVPEINTLPEGIWIRINKDHWPGVNDTPQLEEIRNKVARLFTITTSPRTTYDIDRKAPTPSPEAEKAHIGEQEITQSGEEFLPVNIDSEISAVCDDHEGITTPNDERGTTNTRTTVEVRPLRRILLGTDESRRPVYYDPQSPIDPLDNLNVMISGSSGTGKTQLLKYLVCKLREQEKNVLVLDFKNDFASDSVFKARASLDCVYTSFDGLPFNPLIPYPIRHPNTSELVVQIGQHISGVASVLRRTYGLGPQQQIAVKNAIVDSFAALGIPTAGTTPFDQSMEFPNFSNVGNILLQVNQHAYNRLDPLFTLDLFRAEHRNDSFCSLVDRSVILDLSQIPSDAIKNTIAELLVLSAHAYYNAQPHSGNIRQILVFDEANRVLDSDFMTSLVRECRAYGVGTILSSQYPTDFPTQVSGSMATKILHSNGRDSDRVRTIVQLIGCGGREAEVSSLDRFQAFVDNRHTPHTLIRTMNYPLYLLWSFTLEKRETTRGELAELEGIESDKLPIGNLVQQLERLGLIEEREGRIQLLQSSE